MRYSILIPVYNSENNIRQVVKSIIKNMSKWSLDYEIVLVDDFSKDGSWGVIENLCQAYSEVRGFHLSENKGQQKALYIGLSFCSGDYVLTMDDDGQHVIEMLPKMIDKANEGCDLVYGIYEAYGSKGLRAFGSKWIGFFFKTHYGVLRGLRVSSYRLIHRSILACVAEKPKHFVYLSAELLPFAQKVGNIPMERHQRLSGKSGYTLKTCLVTGLKLFAYYGKGPLKYFLRRKTDETRIDAWCGQLSAQCHSKIKNTWSPSGRCRSI